MDQIVRSEAEISDVLNAAVEGIDGGSKYPGMSYEQGIQDMYLWVTGQGDDEPPLP